MPPKAVVSAEGKLHNIDVGKEVREVFDPAEMMYQSFERNLTGQASVMPGSHDYASDPATFPDTSNPVYSSYMSEASMRYSAPQPGQAPQQGAPPPAQWQQGAWQPQHGPNPSEKAVAAMMEVRDDLVEKYGMVSQDRPLAEMFANAIRKCESAVRSVGGEIEPFDPIQHSSGLKAITPSNSLENAKKVCSNTRDSATFEIEKLTVGRSQDGRPGIGIVVAGVSAGRKFRIQGRVVAKGDFTGTEAIDFVKDAGKGVMTVKAPRQNHWHNVSKDYEIAWQTLPSDQSSA